MTDDALTVMLDELLPGGDGFPAASAIGLAGWLCDHAEFAAPARLVLDALPPGFGAASSAERVVMLHALDMPEAFDRLQVGAYSGYYIHPDVLAVIAARTSYPARPPQPQGYDLSPFDPALLNVVRLRPRSYRKV